MAKRSTVVRLIVGLIVDLGIIKEVCYLLERKLGKV